MPKTLIISGCQRSGTSIMARVVNTHPKIRLQDEERILMTLVWLWHSIRNGEADKNKPWFSPAIQSHMPFADRSKWADIMAGYWIEAWKEYSGDHEYIGDKYPGYIPEHFDLLNKWLDPTWIIMTRKKEETIASMKRCYWNENRSDLSLEIEYHNVVDFIAKIPSDKRCLFIGYEDLCNDPEKVTDNLSSFLGVENLFDTSKVRIKEVSHG